MPEIDSAHPAVAGVIHRDAVPAVVFVFGIPVVYGRFYRQVLNAHFGYFALVTGVNDITATLLSRHGTGQRCIHRQSVALDGCNGAVPFNIDIGGFPAGIVKVAAEIVHLQSANPFPCRRAEDADTTANGQSFGRFHRESGCSGLHQFVGNFDKPVVCLMDISLFIDGEMGFFRFCLSFHIDSCAAVETAFHKYGLSFTHAPKHHARGLDAQRFIQEIGSLGNEDGSAFLGFHCRHLIDGLLQMFRFVHIQHVLHVGNALFGSMIAAGGIVHRHQ